MSALVPPWDWQRVVVQPWTVDAAFSGWIVLMGFLVTAACGLVGNYLLLRRMALVGDAISHSMLLGLVVVFLIFRETSSLWMFVAAAATGMLTVGLVEFIHRQSRVKPDAAICIAFTTLFALGVLLLSVAEVGGPVHIDAECVLYGEISFVALEPPLVLGGMELGPPSVLRMAGVLAGVVILVALFYKELLVTSFDAGLARSIGLRTGVWHYGLMAVLSLVIVAAFEAVGAILAVAMLIVPPMAAAELSDRLPARLGWTVAHAALSALLGFHLSVWLNCSAAGAMVVAGAAIFAVLWAWNWVWRKLRMTVAVV
jgi:manganese/zinc/iron transport system permease protein